jgi:hypothetical protein
MNDKIQIVIAIGSIAITLFFFHSSIIKHNSLTSYQKSNRFDLIFRQAIIIAACIGISFLIQAGSFSLHNLLNKNIAITNHTLALAIFAILSLLVFVLNYHYSKNNDIKDERVVNIKQESLFQNIEPKENKVKPINNYAHYFSGIEYEKSNKDYTVLNVNVKISVDDIDKFARIQNQKIEITPFYTNLISYLNLKANVFQYPKIENKHIENLTKLKDLKHLILDKFKIMNKKHYTPAISQLYQVANGDETEFLSFLNDFFHSKYSSLSLKHAIYYIQYAKKES